MQVQTVPSMSLALVFDISIRLEGESRWKFTNVDEGLDIYEITENSEGTITASMQLTNEDIVKVGFGTFTYLAVNPTGEGELTLDVIYQCALLIGSATVVILAHIV